MTSPPSPHDQQTLIPAFTAVDALVRAEGNSHLAAENLGVTQQVLIASISVDPAAQDSLNMQLRTIATLHTFDVYRVTKELVLSSLSDLGADELVKFFKDINKVVLESTVTAAPQQSGDSFASLMQRLPLNVRQALLAVSESSASPASPTLPFPGSAADEEDAA